MPLQAASLLTPSSIPNVLKLLTDLAGLLPEILLSGQRLTSSLISYVFFPLSTILRRNDFSTIPDQVLEKILVVLALLCEDWWWVCDLPIWEQVFKLCAAIIGGVEGKGKGKDRDDETKEAAARCLLALLRLRNDNERPPDSANAAEPRLIVFQERAQATDFVPVLGQTVDSLLSTTQSQRHALQLVSLELLSILIQHYAPDYLIPTVLPGVVSSMTKLALGVSTRKGWANGDIVAKALGVMEVVIVHSIGDEICLKEGIIHSVEDLEDLAPLTSDPQPKSPSESIAYATARTPPWLRGTSSQLHIAINTLTPLVSHPTPSSLLGLSKFSLAVLAATPLTLPQSQALLLSFLLSLSNSSFETVSKTAHVALVGLLTKSSRAQHPLMQTLMRTTKDNLAALPRLLPSHADAKVEHIAKMIEAVGRLGISDNNGEGLASISAGIAVLLGPSGGIEKWGWSLLSVLEFLDPPMVVSRMPPAQLMLENDPAASEWVPFPETTFKNVSSRSTHDALVRMFNSLGRAAGDACLSSVEWFISVGENGTGKRAVAALWCACRLLEGVSEVSLLTGISGDALKHRRSQRLEKLARALAKSVAELWDDARDNIDGENPLRTQADRDEEEDGVSVVQHVKGTRTLHETLQVFRSPFMKAPKASQPVLHRALCLQLIAVTAGILQGRFSRLLLYTLYPVLHSLVSPVTHLSSTALATLNFITVSASYASPANLLLSNFDYALDAVSRRLTRRWLDVDATKVLVVLVRLVGSHVVDRASDVVEECFDRLDEFHGYGVVVEGLIEVLSEVLKVIETEVVMDETKDVAQSPSTRHGERQDLRPFYNWFTTRHKISPTETDETDYGPAPREAWNEAKGKSTEETNDQSKAIQETDQNTDPPPTPVQALTKQIVSRSLYFLTHGSPVIRARILNLLCFSAPVLPDSALLPSINSAWPFILNRLEDSESFVVSAAASLVEALSTYVGSFMYRRIWDDVWPRFSAMLSRLDIADRTNALARRGHSAVGTESAYTHSHRLYRSVLKTMTAAIEGVDPKDTSIWHVIQAFRKFLHSQVHEELQLCARELYIAIGKNNADAVWLGLSCTSDEKDPTMLFLHETRWDLQINVALILEGIDKSLQR